MGVGLCHVFENTLYLTRDLMKDSAVPSNLFCLKKYVSTEVFVGHGIRWTRGEGV